MHKLPLFLRNLINKLRNAGEWWWHDIQSLPSRAWFLTFMIALLVTFWAGRAYGAPVIEGMEISIVVSCEGVGLGVYTFPSVESFHKWLMWQQGEITSAELLNFWRETEDMDAERAARLGNTLLRCENPA